MLDTYLPQNLNKSLNFAIFWSFITQQVCFKGCLLESLDTVSVSSSVCLSPVLDIILPVSAFCQMCCIILFYNSTADNVTYSNFVSLSVLWLYCSLHLLIPVFLFFPTTVATNFPFLFVPSLFSFLLQEFADAQLTYWNIRCLACKLVSWTQQFSFMIMDMCAINVPSD